MRNKDILNEFRQIAYLKTYLYTDPESRITVKNAIGVDVELKINDNGNVMARIGDSERFICYENMLDHEAWQGILEQLAGQPCQFQSGEENRLEEILTTARLALTLNSMPKHRPI